MFYEHERVQAFWLGLSEGHAGIGVLALWGWTFQGNTVFGTRHVGSVVLCELDGDGGVGRLGRRTM